MDDVQERLERLSPQPGDLLVFAVRTPEDYLKALEACQADAIFIQPGETLECLSDEALRERGLQRIERPVTADPATQAREAAAEIEAGDGKAVSA